MLCGGCIHFMDGHHLYVFFPPPSPSHPPGLAWDRFKWRVQIKSHNKLVTIGRFESEEEAAWAYDTKAKELFVNPVLNFLPDGSLNPDRKAHVLACTYVRKDGKRPFVRSFVRGGPVP